MESNLDIIRVRVDLRDIGSPLVKQAWVSVDRAVQRTIKDFKETLCARFKFPEEQNIRLYLQGCLLLEDETIFILRDDDIIRVVFENFSPLLNSHCSNFVDFASSSRRNSVSYTTDNSHDISFPPAKKARVLPPVRAIESFHDVSASQTSQKDTKCITEHQSRSRTAEVNRLMNLSKTESEGKKRRKRKKHSQAKNEVSSGKNDLSLGDQTNDGTSEAQKSNVLATDAAAHALPRKNVQEQKESPVCEMIKCKKRQIKEVKQSDNVVEESFHSTRLNIIDVFEKNTNCTDFEVSQRGNLMLRKSISQNENNEIICVFEATSEKHQVNEEKIPSKDGVQLEIKSHSVSDKNENYFSLQKEEGKSDNTPDSLLHKTQEYVPCGKGGNDIQTRCGDTDYTPEDVQNQGGQSGSLSESDLQICQCVNSIPCDPASSQTKCEDTVIKNASLEEDSEGYVCTSQNNAPIQLESDCTQSLGNNCPKKKRKRRRKRKFPSHAVSSNSIINNGPSKNPPFSPYSPHTPSSRMPAFPGHAAVDPHAPPSPQCTISESITNLICDIRHNGRKHIRFPSSPESHSEVVKSGCSGNDIGKPAVDVADTNQAQQESFKLKVSCEHSEDDISGKGAPETFHEELKHSDDQHNNEERIINQDNVQETKGSSLQEKNNELYAKFPPLNRFPVVGDIIAFKILELGDSYCPEVSDYKEGRVVGTDNSADILHIDLVEEQVIVRTGKFENCYPDEEPERQVIKKVHVQWSALIEPKLISQACD